MNKGSKCMITVLVFGYGGQVAAQDATGEDCTLAERYYALAQDSLAAYEENEAAGWLERAADACPRFIYYQEFGKIRMQSLDESEKAAAVQAFISAHQVAETDQERAAALYQYASLLNREGDPQNASGLIIEAQRLDQSNREIAELATAIQYQIENPAQNELVRARDASLYQPMPTASEEALNAYPWPPEEPSWRIRVDQNLGLSLRSGVSLLDVEGILSRSLQDATYSESSYYSAPGGFVMVTRLEAIDSDGTPLSAEDRYRLPDEERDFDFVGYIQSLFFAPEGHYRFIAFVVSDKSYSTSDTALTEAEALTRLARGASRLPPEYANLEYTEAHRIDALIYEFRKGDRDRDLETMRPGRIPALTHLNNSGLSETLNKSVPK